VPYATIPQDSAVHDPKHMLQVTSNNTGWHTYCMSVCAHASACLYHACAATWHDFKCMQMHTVWRTDQPLPGIKFPRAPLSRGQPAHRYWSAWGQNPDGWSLYVLDAAGKLHYSLSHISEVKTARTRLKVPPGRRRLT